MKKQLRKARLESAILSLSTDRTVNPKKKLVYQDHIYGPSDSANGGKS
ncbi:MAG: hypothetical protein R3204_10305 [Oceanospirillum sp.]|nr:hypothetical protein [Oceanospirillum sp.]